MYPSNMPPEIKRFYKLEEQYCVIIKQIDATRNASDLAHLKRHRHDIIAEARKIVHNLGVPDSNVCGTRWELG
jgi:effector-associated domain 9 (EAD9)-containing protein